jgi:uncharacterized protein
MSAAALKQRLRADLKAAMQARAKDEVRLLRTLIAALDNAEAVAGESKYVPRAFGDPGAEVPRRELDHGAVADLLAAEVASRRTASAEYRQGGHEAEADGLLREIEMIDRYL